MTKDVPDFALVVGCPAKVVGWVSEADDRLEFNDGGLAFCEKSGVTYRFEKDHVVEFKKYALRFFLCA